MDMKDAEVIGTVLHRFRDADNEHNAIDALVRIATAIESHAEAMHRIADQLNDNEGRTFAQVFSSAAATIANATYDAGRGH
jgi:GTP-sensing pleiotropic transcriptional regulator CodY